MAPELVILIGLQGSGKTTFCRARFTETHAWVSKDHFPNNRRPARRQRQLLTEFLEGGRFVVVDNTNPTAAERAELIALGRTYGARIIGYAFTVPLAVCLERNHRRTGKARVPDVALFATRKRLEWPTPAEGFDELWCVRPAADGGFQILPWEEGDATAGA